MNPYLCRPWTQYTQPRASAPRETKGTAWILMASTFLPGLNPQNPHYIPGYTGHCPLLRFSMGQTYGQMTGQLLRGFPGLAWPPAHRTLLPPIRPPASPEVPRGSLPVRRGHERLSSSMIPGYTGFVPQAQFIFAKNCSRVWAEALNDFTQGSVGQGSQELPKEDKGKKDVEKDQEPKPEPELEAEKEPELGQEADQASPYSMDDKDPRKFFMPGYKFQFGHTYGHLTHDALGLTTLQKQLLV